MKLIRRLRYLLNHRKLDRELAEEMEFHQAMAGRLAMGNSTLAREDARAVWIVPWAEGVAQDLVYALRGFARQPGFTAIAVLALASAIGLNTSLFTVFNAVALRPWNVKEPGRLVKAYTWQRNPPKGFDNAGGFSLAEMPYLERHARTVAGIFAARGEGGVRLEGAKALVGYVSGAYFRVLGLDMERGRGFLPEEDRADAPEAVAVLSHAAWQNSFGGDAEIVGRRIRFADRLFTVVGVAPEGFPGTSPEVTDLWLPMAAMRLTYADEAWVRAFLSDPHNCCVDLSARLAPGASRAAAQAELSVLHVAFQEQVHLKTDGVALAGTALLEKPGRKTRQVYAVFGLMFAGVMLVLLLACANVGNLLLARGAARRREIGIRLSVGAGRARLVRQLLTESLALALLAAAVGVTVAYRLPGPLFRSAVGEVSFDLKPDTTVLGFTLALALLACVAFGLAPAIHATRGNLNAAMQTSPRRFVLRSILLAVQVAISVVLLAGTGLLTRGIQQARTQDLGFRVDGLASVSLEFPAGAYG
ncbi:MAG TPA: ABC transporter permease, partial [Candidatus Sulfopaludibacter sp.]|nr:ABC transporter permease [Candidatus Sulfopaludibacter sp.]